MPTEMLDLLRLDPGTRTLGQLVQEREWAYGEITRLRREDAERRRYAPKPYQAPTQVESRRGLRYLRLREVCRRVGLKTSAVYRLIAIGRFPRQVKLSERAAAWIESEVEAFMASRIEERDKRVIVEPPTLPPYMRKGKL